MKILSFAADTETIEELERFQKKGYKGRSEVIRTAIQSLKEKEADHEKLDGTIDAVLLINHPEKHTESLMQIRHEHQQLIQTHLHTHLQDHHCLELFILKGPAHKIKQLMENYQISKKVSNVKLIVS